MTALTTLTRVARRVASPGQGGHGAFAHRHLDDNNSHKNRHRFDDQGDCCRSCWGMIHDPQRFDATMALAAALPGRRMARVCSPSALVTGSATVVRRPVSSRTSLARRQRSPSGSAWGRKALLQFEA